MKSIRLYASITIEASFIFPFICIVFATVITLCFYLHDVINVSAVAYKYQLEYTYKLKNGDISDSDDFDLASTEKYINGTTIQHRHSTISVDLDKNTLQFDLASDIVDLSVKSKLYSYSDNLRISKALLNFLSTKDK